MVWIASGLRSHPSTGSAQLRPGAKFNVEHGSDESKSVNLDSNEERLNPYPAQIVCKLLLLITTVAAAAALRTVPFYRHGVVK